MDLRTMRKAKGLTQDQLAKIAKVNKSYICLLEKGMRSNPSIQVALRLACALDVRIEDLFGDNGAA